MVVATVDWLVVAMAVWMVDHLDGKGDCWAAWSADDWVDSMAA